MAQLLIRNCRRFDALSEQPTSILVKNGTIAAIGRFDTQPADCEVLDAQGRIICPGFIDVHIQGAGGADVLDARPEALEIISRTSARFGVTGFLATTVFKPGQKNEHLAAAAGRLGRDLGGAELLGIHLEGPFISADKRGMIQPDCICSASERVLDEVLELTRGHLAMMTVAPELPGCAALIRRLVDSGVVASFGHSGATYEQTLEGIGAGITHVTHLFNAMQGLHHRSPGPVPAIVENRQVSTQLISDGVHVLPPVIRLAFELLGADRIVPITDGMQAMGLPDGKYLYNGIEYESRDGTARYSDGTLIGTALGLSELVRNLMSFTGCTLTSAVKMASANPAKVLGLGDKKGTIEVGKDADLVLINEDFQVHATVVRGKVVFDGR